MQIRHSFDTLGGIRCLFTSVASVTARARTRARSAARHGPTVQILNTCQTPCKSGTFVYDGTHERAEISALPRGLERSAMTSNNGFSFTFEPDHEPANELEAAAMTVQRLSHLGVILSTVGLLLTQSVMRCPGDTTPATYEALNEDMRVLTAGADPENPVVFGAVAYLVRALTGDNTALREKPGPEECLAIVERWQRGEPAVGLTRSFADQRRLYAKASALASQDIQQVTHMLKVVRQHLATLEQ